MQVLENCILARPFQKHQSLYITFASLVDESEPLQSYYSIIFFSPPIAVSPNTCSVQTGHGVCGQKAICLYLFLFHYFFQSITLRIWVLLFLPHALVCCLHIRALIKSLCCAGICRRSVWVGFSCKSCRRRDIHYQAHRGNDFQHWGPTRPSSNWTCLQQTRFPHHQTMANKSKPGKCLIHTHIKQLRRMMSYTK